MEPAFGLKFWGTRGLISSPHADKAIYGGNTPCIQVLHGDDVVIVDTGFGVSILGEALMDRILNHKERIEAHIFFTHFHWDHIQGLPFFHPIYFKTSTLHLYSPMPREFIYENLDQLFDGSYSPFAGIGSMMSTIHFHHLTHGVTLPSGLGVTHTLLDHPADCFAYRFTGVDGRAIVVASDHEGRSSQKNDELRSFATGAELLVHDAQYLQSEYKARAGWGHSTPEQALENALAAKCQRVLLTNHHPKRRDLDLQGLQKSLHKHPKFSGVDFEFAREEVVYEVGLRRIKDRVS